MSRRPDGALETEVLHVLWAADNPLLPAEVKARLRSTLAYTSVATVLSRLHAKGLAVRTPAGRGFAYQASVDESDLAVRRIDELLDAASDRATVLSRFIGRLSAREAKAVRSLLDHTDRGPSSGR